MGLLDTDKGNRGGGYLHPIIFESTEGPPVPGTEVPCLMCEKKFVMPVYSGEPDQICGECWNTYMDLARIICSRCRITICRHEPCKLDNGFEILPRAILHSDCCNVCRPGLETCTILEIEHWLKVVRPKKLILPVRGLWTPKGIKPT